MAKDSKGGAFKALGGTLLLGLAAGAAIGFLTGTKKGKKITGDMEKRLTDWMEDMHAGKEDLEVKIKRIFGVVTKEAGETYGRVKGEVLATINSKSEDLKPGEYEKIVDRLVAKYQKKFNLAAATSQRLKDDIIAGLSNKDGV